MNRRIIAVTTALLLAACSGSQKTDEDAVEQEQHLKGDHHGGDHHEDGHDDEGHHEDRHDEEHHDEGHHGEGHNGEGHHGETDHDGHHHGHRFEDADKWAKRFNDPKRDAWQKPKAVMTYMKLEPGMTVVDLGTGTGYFLPHLSNAVGEDGAVIGLDIEPNMVEYVKEKAEADGLDNVSARVVKPDAPGLEPGSVDRILIVNTWHHIGKRQAYTRKLTAALTPKGKVIIVDYTKEADQGPPVEMRLTPEEVVKELEGGGLKAEVIEEDLPKQYVVVGTLP